MASYPELRGKTAIVTGGNTGIGHAIARKLAEQGVRVAVTGSRHPEKTEAVVAELRKLDTEVLPLTADLTRGSEAERMVCEVTERLGPVDILVNCAGGFYGRRRVEETPEDEWDLIIDINLKSTFVCSKAVLPGMIERRWGRIINIASETGRMPLAHLAAHYAAAKAGVLGFTRHLAREVAEYGVTVNATAPSTTYSDRVRSILTPELEAAMRKITPIGRIAQVEEQAGLVVFLASDEAGYITGATVDVAGGKVMM